MGQVENYFYFLCIYLLLKLFCLVVPKIITFSKLLLVLLYFPSVFPQNISFLIFDQFLTSVLAPLRISQSTLSRLGLNFLNKLTFNFSAISRSNHCIFHSRISQRCNFINHCNQFFTACFIYIMTPFAVCSIW